MFVHARSKDRPYHLGPFPLETLPRDDSPITREASRPRVAPPPPAAPTGPLGQALRHYRDIYAGLAEAEMAKQPAPVPDDLDRRAADVKGLAYFMNADQVGVCRIPLNAWCAGAAAEPHSHAIVILVAHGRIPEPGNLARDWIAPAVGEAAEMRAAEIAVCVARHIRAMGFAARADVPGCVKLDQPRLAVLAGLGLRDGERVFNPYAGDAYALAIVSADYELACDRPLASGARRAKTWRYWWGIGGATSGRERNRRARRRAHDSRYPMETVKRVDRPTTLILDDEVPRVPKRAAFFERALQGDLGEKSKAERSRFSFKHPVSWAQLGMIRALVPHQDGPVAPAADPRLANPAANARAIKALSYFLGADLTGICEIPHYAWYSHKTDGTPLEPYHRYAVVMLIDQEFDTMEGASGDDWISGAQSMRGYLRGAAIAGILGETLRALGLPAKAQTNADSDVLHIPLVLWAGLGELSRIGELVLNPFVGPRFKSVVLTTDLPLEPDKPIDFGLQTFCNNCMKCARECPCDAIPWGDKVMFNGYEIWKPDVERCTRYRLTNSKGSACGRCMKTCPLNKVVDADGALLTRAASWLGVNAMWLKPLLVPIATWIDDRLGNGRRNPAKKWWFDHEIVGGVAVAAKGTNRRDIDPGRKLDPAKHKVAYYHANMMPPPDAAGPIPVDRKAALAAADMVETPDQARARKEAGGPPPPHYTPTPPAGQSAAAGAARALSPFETAKAESPAPR